VRSVLARSLIRLLVRSDTREPVVYCDALFFASTSAGPQLLPQIVAQAEALAAHMQVPVVHACSTLPAAPVNEAAGGYVREVKTLGYHVYWVDLLEIDGVSPYTYAEARAARARRHPIAPCLLPLTPNRSDCARCARESRRRARTCHARSPPIHSARARALARPPPAHSVSSRTSPRGVALRRCLSLRLTSPSRA
jgi:hypothetical protein